MLEKCGMKSLDELYADVPEQLLLKRDYDVAPEMSEKEVRDFFRDLDAKNKPLTCFAGQGFYHRYSPSAVNYILSRSEFLTAYTPYQPEISQGTLQYIFEYQSMMASLTGLEVSNASMYDGSTATAEALIMTVAASRKKKRVLVSATMLPHVIKVAQTYALNHGVEITVIDEENGVTSRSRISEELAKGDVAGVAVATPNRYGILEDYTGLADEVHGAKALLVMYANAADLGVIRTPGEWNADIAVGDAQSLGMPLNFGGPYLGYLCATKALMRKMPGRIVGATTDDMGQRVFVLTLQAREQHIRREKATSNICSNQGLMALYVSVYLSLLGPDGLRQLCMTGHAGAVKLSQMLVATGKVSLTYPDKPFLNEFLVTTAEPVDLIIERCVEAGVLPGVKVDDNHLLIAVTEMQTVDDYKKLCQLISNP